MMTRAERARWQATRDTLKAILGVDSSAMTTDKLAEAVAEEVKRLKAELWRTRDEAAKGGR